MGAHLKSCRNDAARHVEWLLKVEERNTFTVHESLYRGHRDKLLAFYLAHRSSLYHGKFMRALDTIRARHPRAPVEVDYVHEIIDGFKHLGIDIHNRKDLARVISDDRYDKALEIMADVRAYFQGDKLSSFCETSY